jgi:hypothetical protein
MKKLAIVLTVLLTSCNNTLDSSKMAIDTKSDSVSGCWIDFRIGELPPMGYYDGIDSLVKRWNLCYTRMEGGCVIDDSTEFLSKKYKIENDKYFTQLEAKLGKDWKLKFDSELHILDSINWIKINSINASLKK